MKSYPLIWYGCSHSFCGGSPTWRPLLPQPGTFSLPPRSGIGLVCGFAATDSSLYYNRVPLVINFSYTQDSCRDAQPQLSVPATVLRFSLVSTWRAGKAWPSPTTTPSGAIFLRAKGYSRRCGQSESVAAQRHLSPRRPAACESTSNLSGRWTTLPIGTAYFFFLRWTMRASSAQSKKYGSVA